MNPLLLAADGRWIAVDGKGRIGRSTATLPKRPLRKVKNLLEPKSAAVLGASASAMNPGRIILRNLKVSEGIRYGHLWAVHPKEEAIDGIPCVTTVAELPGERRPGRDLDPGRRGAGRDPSAARDREGRVDHPDPGRLRRDGEEGARGGDRLDRPRVARRGPTGGRSSSAATASASSRSTSTTRSSCRSTSCRSTTRRATGSWR